MLVLTMDIQQKAGDLTQAGRSHCLVIYPADAAGGSDFARHNDQAVGIRLNAHLPQGPYLLLPRHGKYQLNIRTLELADKQVMQLEKQQAEQK